MISIHRTGRSVQLVLAIALPLSVSAPVTLSAPVQAQAVQQSVTSWQNPQYEQNKQSRPARGQVAGRWRGGGKRERCPVAQTPLTALVPYTEVAAQPLPIVYVGGVTTLERPTFWFYVPYTLSADLTAEFVLQNDANQEVYRVSSATFGNDQPLPGLVKISLPASAPALETGRLYRWFFKINCEGDTPIYTEGGIERIAVETALARQLSSTSPLQRAALYQDNNIWFDAITTLGELRQERPDDRAIATAWNNLLQSAGITDLPAVP